MPPRRPAGSGAGRYRDGYFSPAPPRILAHRGFAQDAPENTLLAFAKALSTGVGYLETDVHASLDGAAVISHDPDLVRVAGRGVRVDQLKLAELRRIELGHGQTFASLAAALDAFPEARFNIDVKSDAAVQPTVDAILAANATARVLVTSFSDARRIAVVRQLPVVATSASARSFALALAAARLGLATAMRRVLNGVDAVQVPERWRGMRIVTPRMIRALHAAGVEVHVWTVNEPNDMARLLAFGVDGLITDRPDAAIRLVRDLPA